MSLAYDLSFFFDNVGNLSINTMLTGNRTYVLYALAISHYFMKVYLETTDLNYIL